MIASEGVCKALWLKEAIKLLVWVILGKKIAFRFACLTTLSNFKLHPHLVSFVLRSLREYSRGARCVIVIIVYVAVLLSSSLSDSLAWCINRLSGING